jgi:hypothetical protein
VPLSLRIVVDGVLRQEAAPPILDYLQGQLDQESSNQEAVMPALRRTVVVILTVVAISAGSTAAAVATTPSTPPPNQITQLISKLRTEITNAENNPQLQGDIGALEILLGQVEDLALGSCVPTLVSELLGLQTGYGPPCV